MNSSASQNEELYRAAVGDAKAGYYVPLFYRFDQPGASRASWNWPAFFVTFFWLLYRRMYGPAVVYVMVWPIALVILAVVVGMLLGDVAGALVYWIAALGVQLVALPMFANAVFHWHVRNQIRKLSADTPSHAALVQRLIGQASTSGAAAIVGVICIGGLAAGGLVAAVALPAYQDYTIRAQVAEGLTVAAPVKNAVAQAYAATGTLPATLRSIELDPHEFEGQYVRNVEIYDGAVLIHYGKSANPLLAGRTLSLHPATLENGDIEWSCGYSAGKDVTQTDVAPKYLPTSCQL